MVHVWCMRYGGPCMVYGVWWSMYMYGVWGMVVHVWCMGYGGADITNTQVSAASF